MIALAQQNLKVYLCTQPTDMRKSFDGLSGLAASLMQQDPLSGHLFVFRNRSGDRLKILYWDQDGLAIWYKRLERGSFQFPEPAADPSARGTESQNISMCELSMLLYGIDLKSATKRRRYQRKAASQASATAVENPCETESFPRSL